jgi:hypothetical protein
MTPPPSVSDELKKDHPNKTYAELYAQSLMPIFKEMCFVSVGMGAEYEPDMTVAKVERYQTQLHRLIDDLESYKKRHFNE